MSFDQLEYFRLETPRALNSLRYSIFSSEEPGCPLKRNSDTLISTFATRYDTKNRIVKQLLIDYTTGS